MRKPTWLVIPSFILMLLLLGNDGCRTGDEKQKSETGAEQMTELYKVPLNSAGLSVEQQNIVERLKVTTDFTKILWIHLLALDGKLVNRMVVRNKVTSSGKRLEPTTASSSSQGGRDYPQYKNFETNEFIQHDGTFGSSDNYIFWFDPQGRYHQLGTNGSLCYLLTDYPIDLENPIDKITGLYRAELLALQYQKEQEAILKKQAKEQENSKK